MSEQTEDQKKVVEHTKKRGTEIWDLDDLGNGPPEFRALWIQRLAACVDYSYDVMERHGEETKAYKHSEGVLEACKTFAYEMYGYADEGFDEMWCDIVNAFYDKRKKRT